MKFMPKVLSIKTIHKGRILTIETMEVELKEGRKSLREIIRCPRAVMIVPVTRDGEYVLTRQYRAPLNDFNLEFPAGVLEDNEDPAECARRELQEETGYTAGRVTAVGQILASEGMIDQKLYIFLAEDLTPGEQQLEGEEDIAVEKYSLPQLIQMINQGKIKGANSLSSLLLAQNYKKE